MNIVNKLTIRHLKENKRRSIITICGIIISVAMITAVTSSAVSFMNTMGKASAITGGDWAAEYVNVPAENIDTAKKDKNFDRAIVSKDLGEAMIGNSLDEDGLQLLSVRAQEPGTFDTVKVSLYEGTYPEKENEILIDSSYISMNQLDWKVGDTITLNNIIRSGEIHDENGNTSIEEKPQFSSFSPGDTGKITSSRDYKLVGIVNDSVRGTAPNYGAVTGLDISALAKTDNVDIYLQSANPKMGISNSIKELYAKMTVTDNSKMTTNGEYLSFSGATFVGAAAAVYAICAFIMILIMIASVAMIYNAFAISISERSRYLGMLASVGATKRQKRNTVYFEGAILGLIGIPLGIFFGLAGIGTTFKFIDPLFQNTFYNNTDTEIHLVLKVSLIGILISVLLSVITILISAYIPGRIASKTTAIDAIRKTNDIKIKAKKLKTSKLTRKLFGFDGELAKKNLKRTKKKYNVIAMSLAISVTLFIGVTSFTSILTATFNVTNGVSKSDISIGVTNEKDSSQVDEYLKSLKGIDSVTKSVSMRRAIVANSGNIKDFDKMAAVTFDYGVGKKAIGLVVKGLEDEKFKEYCKTNGIDSSSYFDATSPKVVVENEITYLSQTDEENSKMVVTNPLLFKEGEKIVVDREDVNDNTQQSFEVTAGKVLNKSSESNSYVVQMFMPMSVFNRVQQQNKAYASYLYEINCGDPTSLYKKVNEDQRLGLLPNNSYIDSQAAIEQSNRSMIVILSVFVYGFITLMSMVSVTNIFNTINTGMNSRRREFAMLKSVGMSPKSFKKMIFMESVFYGIKALTIGLISGFIVNLAMYLTMKSSVDFPVIRAFNPWMYLIAIVAVAVVVGAALLYSFQKVKKDNIIETIKNDDN